MSKQSKNSKKESQFLVKLKNEFKLNVGEVSFLKKLAKSVLDDVEEQSLSDSFSEKDKEEFIKFLETLNFKLSGVIEFVDKSNQDKKQKDEVQSSK